jgi:hypothetical protein
MILLIEKFPVYGFGATKISNEDEEDEKEKEEEEEDNSVDDTDKKFRSRRKRLNG